MRLSLSTFNSGIKIIKSTIGIYYSFVHFFEIKKLYRKDSNLKVIALTEHIGDIVACEPVARYLKMKNDNSPIVWVINQRFSELLMANPNVDLIISVDCLSEWIYLKKLLKLFDITAFDLHIDTRVCLKYGLRLNNPNNNGITPLNYYNFGGILETLSMAGGLPKLNDAPRFYLPTQYYFSSNLPEKYLTIQVLSNEKQRNWEIDKWNELISMMGGYTFIELGQKSSLKSSKNCITSFCGKTSLLDIAFIIKNSLLFIGIDSSFAHFANALNIPAVILLGHYRDYKKYMPYSGNFLNGKLAEIIQYNGKVADIPVQLVEEKLKFKLKDVS